MERLGMGQNPWCTPECFVWINEEDELASPSREGLTELEDSAVALQIYHKILPYYLITTAMYQQVISGSIDHMLPPLDKDNQVMEYIQIDSKTQLEEELEYNNDEDEEEVERTVRKSRKKKAWEETPGTIIKLLVYFPFLYLFIP